MLGCSAGASTPTSPVRDSEGAAPARARICDVGRRRVAEATSRGVDGARAVVLHLTDDESDDSPLMESIIAALRREVGLVQPVSRHESAESRACNQTRMSTTLARRDRLAAALLDAAIAGVMPSSPSNEPMVIATDVAAAAALVAAAGRPDAFASLVLVDGRVDLAERVCRDVRVPVLLLVDQYRQPLVDLNRLAASRMTPRAQLMVLPGDDAGPVDRSVTQHCALVATRRWLQASANGARARRGSRCSVATANWPGVSRGTSWSRRAFARWLPTSTA